jgi:hypothetical protein
MFTWVGGYILLLTLLAWGLSYLEARRERRGAEAARSDDPA